MDSGYYKGLGVKLAVNEVGTVRGMIQYIPIKLSNVEGSDLYFIKCIQVHGYTEGHGDFQKKVFGKIFLKAAEEVGHKVLTAAEFSGKDNYILEFKRKELYEEKPPSQEFLNWLRLPRYKKKIIKPPL